MHVLAPAAGMENSFHTALFPRLEVLPNSLVVLDVSLLAVVPECGNDRCEVVARISV